MQVLASSISTNGEPFVPDDRLTYGIPDTAIELLDPILGPYGQDPHWYLDKLNYGRSPAPWAIACLDREYPLAGHVATTRPTDAGISFAPYEAIPIPLPTDYAPGVGVLVFGSKKGLEHAASRSALFEAAWSLLSDASATKRWLIVIDPLPESWLATALPGDRMLWLGDPAALRFRKNFE